MRIGWRRILGCAAALVVTILTASLSAQASPLDAEMTRLARERGCSLCHWEPEPRSSVDSVLPPAPSWREIARRYRGQPGAEDRLVAIVMRGAGPGNRHWAGKTSAVEMPPNRVEITEDEARRLIRAILR